MSLGCTCPTTNQRGLLHFTGPAVGRKPIRHGRSPSSLWVVMAARNRALGTAEQQSVTGVPEHCCSRVGLANAAVSSWTPSPLHVTHLLERFLHETRLHGLPEVIIVKISPALDGACICTEIMALKWPPLYGSMPLLEA